MLRPGATAPGEERRISVHTTVSVEKSCGQGCKSSSFKGISSSYKERVPKNLIVTSSYSAKKGTHIRSYTLLLHEKIATFIFKTLLTVA